MKNINAPRALIIDDADNLTNQPGRTGNQSVVDYDDGIKSVGVGRGRTHSGSRTTVDYRIDWRAWIVGAVTTFVVVGGAGFFAVQFLEYKYATDLTFRNTVDLFWYVTILTGLASVVVGAFLGAQLLWNKAQMSGIVILPGNMVTHIRDVANGWHRTAARDMARAMMEKHFDVQGRAADQSLYRQVQYLTVSKSNSSSTEAMSGLHEDVDKDLPTLAELLGINALTDDEALDTAPEEPTTAIIQTNGKH